MYTPISVPPSVRFTAAVLISALLCVAATDARSQDRPDRPFRPDRRPVETEPRSIDGSGNNTVEPLMGAAETVLVRVAPSDYADGLSELAGADRASARAVSNALCAQSESLPNAASASDYLWQWGQFLDHDIDLTDGADPTEVADIAVPAGDPFFDPFGTGTQTIAMNRSAYDAATGTSGPREQVNSITSWIDASNVYGSDEVRAAALRTNDGTGRLRTSDGDLLPFNTDGLPNAGGTSETLFLAGDVRANEQVGLLAMHTLFVREHNRIVDRLRRTRAGRNMSGDELYEAARRTVGAEMQAITYNEFLPLLLGRDALTRYRGYDPSVEAGIRNEFSTASYRFGHSLLNTTLLRLDRDGIEVAEGHLALRDAFFAPQRLTDEGGIDPVLRGLAAQASQTVDTQLVDDVRNFLFGPPGSGGFDLASLNIQRGRDHGLAGYNDLREAYGLAPAVTFSEISTDPDVVAALASVYATPDDVDAWIGGLAEDHVTGALVGETLRTVLASQFEALRDGDRFWYQRTLGRRDVRRAERMTLARIVRANTGIGREIGRDVFIAR